MGGGIPKRSAVVLTYGARVTSVAAPIKGYDTLRPPTPGATNPTPFLYAGPSAGIINLMINWNHLDYVRVKFQSASVFDLGPRSLLKAPRNTAD